VISVDGLAEEAPWRAAPRLGTQVWEVSPYETGEEGPTFRLLGTAAGVYLFAESGDDFLSGFRGTRMLSDAIFIGAFDREASAGSDPRERTVVVLFPFGSGGCSRAVRAVWSERSPVGVDAAGVHMAGRTREGEPGWQCEAFVPWDALGVKHPPLPGRLALNMGAWDNDGELFTELHSWAPTRDAALWGDLLLLPPADR
jgi:hypothetical protein